MQVNPMLCTKVNPIYTSDLYKNKEDFMQEYHLVFTNKMQIPKSCESDAKNTLHDVVTLVSSPNIFTPAIVHYVIHHHLTFRVQRSVYMKRRILSFKIWPYLEESRSTV